MIRVANIRLEGIKITKEPIVYYWWFKTTCFSELLNLPYKEIDAKSILIIGVTPDIKRRDNYGSQKGLWLNEQLNTL